MEAALDNARAGVCGRRLTPANKANDTFFELGGDLVDASLLSAHMERQGYKLTVEHVLKNPTLLNKHVAANTGLRLIENIFRMFPCFGVWGNFES